MARRTPDPNDTAFHWFVVTTDLGPKRKLRRLRRIVAAEGPFTLAQAHAFMDALADEQELTPRLFDRFRVELVRGGNPLGVPNPWLIDPFNEVPA